MTDFLHDPVAGGAGGDEQPSRIGTPEEIRVPRVRVKRATAILRISMPTTGTFSRKVSIAMLPWSVL